MDINMNKIKRLSEKNWIYYIIYNNYICYFLFIIKKIKKTSIYDEQLIQTLLKTEPLINNGLTPTNYEKEVLLIAYFFSNITNYQNGVSSDILNNILLQIKTIILTVLDIYAPDLDNKDNSYLKNFDLVVLDFIDDRYNLTKGCRNSTIN